LKTRGTFRVLLGMGAVLLALLFAACEWFDYPLDKFQAQQTGTVAVQTARAVTDTVAIGTDGYICVAPGTTTIVIPIDNPNGLSIGEDGLISAGSLPAGVSVSARQSDDKNAIEITFDGTPLAEGDEFSLHLTIKTEKEGRLLTEQDLNIACISFETRLSALTVSHGTSITFDQDTFLYSINGVPVDTVTIAPTPINGQAAVSIAGDQGGGTVLLGMGTNTVTVRVSAAHGAALTEYELRITRIPAADTKNISVFSLAGVQVTPINDSNKGKIDDAAGTIVVILPWGTSCVGTYPG